MEYNCGDGSSSPSAAQMVVEELRKELEHERLLRRRAEGESRALARELAEERQARGRLEEELERKRAEAERAEREMEEERRMLQIAELWREERVQIKLLEAKVAMEEKLQQMVMMNATASDGQRRAATKVKVNECKSQCGGQAKKEAVENPHIRRGIRGHVEFPKVVRTATQHKGGGGWKVDISNEANLECQRAQLRVLMRHKNVNGGAFATSINFVS
ncbi:protein BRANCHLESS TRICHOME-like [Zingiber officinale]|uniref:Uncharacterized protein n=1 Tax=Zingiber officinale TaxID=94328 RepID=A0A8J5GU07_ZINOF|nr:protein BRANCHLESS TRICHOME-like [Zingiber officinale]KAG6511523.1 hypothetical protein ZIOFF_029591 [Zingiber officinale]